ncbi:MAG: flagellar export protein FliJ [Gemmatimonadetes bacterium]|nr:flagellar export protein FliJ [Gemmatimonadota bacterium]
MFKFRLQRILELRAQKEQAEARALAAARVTAEQAVAAQAELAALRADSQAQLHAATGETTRIGHLTQLGHALAALDVRVDQAGEVVQQADAEVLVAAGRLELAARDRRVLDRLKGRHEDVYRADAAQRDRVAMDEIALQRFARQQDGTASASPADAAPASTSDTTAS